MTLVRGDLMLFTVADFLERQGINEGASREYLKSEALKGRKTSNYGGGSKG